MRTAYFDTSDPEMYWGNPNLYWGNPSYLLEPGDAGYVPPVPTVNPTKNKKKHMKRNTYYPSRVTDQVAWLVQLANALPGKATVLGLTTAQVNAIVADCLWLAYLLQAWLDAVRGFSSGCTQTVTAAQTGSGTSVIALNTFTAPPLPLTPVAVTAQLPGSLTRIFIAVADIKNSHKLTDTVAAELGLMGSELAGPDLSTVQPIITATVSGNHVIVKWSWNGHSRFLHACEILVNRNDGKGFVPLVIDTTPDYNDTMTFPATQAIWIYKAIYRMDDMQVGQWSQTASVTVGG